MSEIEQYQYARGFQERQVALILRDPSFLRDYRDVLNPSYFDSDELVILSRLAVSFFEGCGEVPNRDSIKEQLREYCVGYEVSDRLRNELEASLDQVYKVELSNIDSIKAKTIRFGQRQALKDAVYSIGHLVKKDEDFDEARHLVEQALQIGCNTTDLGFHLGEGLLKLPTYAKESTYSSTQKIPTYWSTFDRKTGGGPARKEVWMLMGMSGIGKSINLVQLGVSGLLAGTPVVHFTIGDLTDIDVGLRYGSRLTGCTIPEIIHNSEKFQERAKARARHNNNLWVKFYPSGTAKMSDLRAYLSKLKFVKGVSPGLIIIDYPDELIFEDMYRDLGAIYSEIQAVSKEYNAVVWVVSQVDRSAPLGPKEVITISHTDHSKLKYTKIDGAVSFNQTIAESREGIGRIWVDKVRRWPDKYMIHVDVDKSTCSVIETKQAA